MEIRADGEGVGIDEFVGQLARSPTHNIALNGILKREHLIIFPYGNILLKLAHESKNITVRE